MKKVLFVCIGNCCRSQMAEGFARAYGSDVIEAASAGLAPTPSVAAQTIETMLDKNIDITAQFPKLFDPDHIDADLVINMSGMPLPCALPCEVRDWSVEDPYGRSMQVYQRTCLDVENRVMLLILELRRKAR